MSLIARHCEANAVPRVADLLAAADIHVPVVGFTPFTRTSSAVALAALFDTREQEIVDRMHGPYGQGSDSDVVNYFGAALERRHFDDRLRRVSLKAVEREGMHRPAWALRALSFCPWTFEELTSTCMECRAPLGWSRCNGFDRCDRCGKRLQETQAIDDGLREDLHILSGLLSTEPIERANALATLPQPFGAWDLNAVLDAICELGAVATTSPTDWLSTNTALRGGSFRFLGPRGLAEGLQFLGRFDESLSAFAARTYQEVGSTSVHRGFGILSRHFSAGARQRPLTELIRERFPSALLSARVPVKRQSSRYQAVEEAAASITMVEARRAAGIAQRVLARLEGKSSTFLARCADRGGTALFSKRGIEDLRSALNETIPASEAATALGIPIYVVRQFVEDGLIKETDNRDVQILYGPGQRITAASVEELSERLRRLPGAASDDGILLAQGLRRRADPKAWSLVTHCLLAGTCRTVASESLHRVSLADTRVIKADLKLKRVQIPLRRLEGETSCRDVAAALGTSPQFIAEAVSRGLIEGEVKRGGSTVSLASVGWFQEAYILSSEIAARSGRQLHQVRTSMTAAGFSPIDTVYRVNLWDRPSLEEYLDKSESESRRAGRI